MYFTFLFMYYCRYQFNKNIQVRTIKLHISYRCLCLMITYPPLLFFQCAFFDPCWNISSCINTQPGYQCLECPNGYTGTYEDGLAHNITMRVFVFMNKEHATLQEQTCDDVNECDVNNGGCDVNMECHNTIVIILDIILFYIETLSLYLESMHT